MWPVYLRLLAAVACWGGTFTAGRYLAPYMGPYEAAFLRFFLASVCLVWLTVKLDGSLPRLKPKQWLPVLVLGLTGVFAYNALFFTGLKTVHAGRAAVIVATNPILTTLVAAVWFKEVLTPVKLLGVALSVAGATTVISHGDPMALISQGLSHGDLAICGCVLVWSAYSLVGKVAMEGLSPVAAVTYSSLVGTALLALPAFGQGLLGHIGGYALEAWLAVAYLGILGTVAGFTWFYMGVKALGPGRASVFINFVPIFGVLVAWAVLGEAPDATLLLGVALVCCGVYLVNRPVQKIPQKVLDRVRPRG